jgi:hypothetical protein
LEPFIPVTRCESREKWSSGRSHHKTFATYAFSEAWLFMDAVLVYLTAFLAAGVTLFS